jgi:hypothetical protein
MTHRFSATALLGLTLLCGSGATLARTVHLSAAMSNFHYTTIDLTPDDAVRGGAIFDERDMRRSAFVSLYVPGGPADCCVQRVDPKGLDPIALHTDFRSMHAQAAEGSGWLGDITMSSNVTTGVRGNSQAYVQRYQQFTLLAHSAITFSGHIAVHADGIGIDGAETYGGSTSAGLTVEARNMYPDPQRQRFWLDNLQGSMDTHNLVELNADLARDFSFTYTNESNANRSMWLSSGAWIEAENYAGVPSVPEPAGYAMFGAGLLILAARRRLS